MAYGGVFVVQLAEDTNNLLDTFELTKSLVQGTDKRARRVKITQRRRACDRGSTSAPGA